MGSKGRLFGLYQKCQGLLLIRVLELGQEVVSRPKSLSEYQHEIEGDPGRSRTSNCQPCKMSQVMQFIVHQLTAVLPPRLFD